MTPTREQQFEALAFPLASGLFQAALQIVEDRSSAETAVCDVFAAAWKSFQDSMEQSEVRVLLFRLLFTRVRKMRRQEPGAATTATALLSRLPQHLREVVLLVDVQGFSYRQAAEILGSSLDELEASLRLARNQLCQNSTIQETMTSLTREAGLPRESLQGE